MHHPYQQGLKGRIRRGEAANPSCDAVNDEQHDVDLTHKGYRICPLGALAIVGGVRWMARSIHVCLEQSAKHISVGLQGM